MIEHMQLACGSPKETVFALMMLYKNTNAGVQSPDCDIDFFEIVVGVLQGIQ